MKDKLEFDISQGVQDSKKSKNLDPELKRAQKMIEFIDSLNPILIELESFQLNINHEKNFSEKQFKEMEHTILNSETKIEDLKKKLNDLRDKHRDSESTLQSKEKAISRLQNEISKLESTEVVLKNKVNDLNQYKIKFEKSKDQGKLVNENESLIKENQNLKHLIENNNKEIKDYIEKFTTLKRESDSKINNLNREIQEKSSIIQKLEAIVAEQNKSLEEYRKDLQSSSNQLKVESNRFSKESQSLTLQLKGAENLLSKEKELSASLKEKIKQLEFQIQDSTTKLKQNQQAQSTELKNIQKEIENERLNFKKEIKDLQFQLQQQIDSNIGLNNQIEVYKEMLESSPMQEFQQIQNFEGKFDKNDFDLFIQRVINIIHIIEKFDITKPEGLNLRLKFISDQLNQKRPGIDSASSIFSLKDFEAFDYFSRIVKGDFAESSNASSISFKEIEKLLNESNDEIYNQITYKMLYKQFHELGTSTVSVLRQSLFPFSGQPSSLQQDNSENIHPTQTLNENLKQNTQQSIIQSKQISSNNLKRVQNSTVPKQIPKTKNVNENLINYESVDTKKPNLESRNQISSEDLRKKKQNE